MITLGELIRLRRPVWKGKDVLYQLTKEKVLAEHMYEMAMTQEFGIMPDWYTKEVKKTLPNEVRELPYETRELP